MIEEGGRKRPPIVRERRTCHWCPTKVENETHFLTECILYASRTHLYHRIETTYPAFATLDTSLKLIYLMSQEDPNITLELATRTQEWFDLRAILDLYFFQP